MGHKGGEERTGRGHQLPDAPGLLLLARDLKEISQPWASSNCLLSILVAGGVVMKRITSPKTP